MLTSLTKTSFIIMKSYFKGASLLLYLLAMLSFFIIGLFYAGFIDAGKNQGLAGGAIVLGYGIMGAGIGLIASLFLVAYDRGRAVITTNKVLAILLAALIIALYLKASN